MRWAALTVLAGGTLFQSGCDVAAAVLQTIALAFDIVGVWV